MINLSHLHPEFMKYLKSNPALLEHVLFYPEELELIKIKYKDYKNKQFITKLQNMSILIKMMGMTNDQ